MNLLFITFNTVHYRNAIFYKHFAAPRLERSHARAHSNPILIARLNPHSRYICRGDVCKIFRSHSEFEGKTKIIDQFQI